MEFAKSSQEGEVMTEHRRGTSAFTSGMGELIGSGGHRREKASVWLTQICVTLMATE